ncbi:SGNH/GDSL hydrolase family protein [Nocardioides islandensis]|uniref:SGNH/GDSL hydrolase family protein n=1 Tax=Nocardioides islandensis TaxID=433663 RepID=A0A930YI34_9ACTN|nr:GDSL-type esterase/lipase family protein [Nocardioides islandensis]MBF4763574.1 SGNH/GDSL hydrolase family protein [Nocardioides islandensis]
MSLGDSWPEGAHCNGCRTFPQLHAEMLQESLGEPVTLVDLAGQAQPSFDAPGGGGSAGLLHALRTAESFRAEVATGDIIVIATGPNDGGEIFEQIMDGTCGGKDDAGCVVPLARTWMREFDAILDEIEALRAGLPTAIRLVNAANAFNDPTASAATRRGFAAYFQALTVALCDNAEAHHVVCVDVRPVLNGPDFDQPVDDSTQESMDAVAELLRRTGVPELE